MFNKDDGFAGPATCNRHIVDRRHLGIVSTRPRKHVTADIRPSSPVQRGRKGQIVDLMVLSTTVYPDPTIPNYLSVVTVYPQLFRRQDRQAPESK